MSPRSGEYMAAARDHLVAASAALRSGGTTGAVSSAYYATLNAARAALSEEDEQARTHRGTWHRFHERFVSSSQFDAAVYRAAASSQHDRIGADYEAQIPGEERAEAIVTDAERFVAAVAEMLGEED